MIAVLWKDYRLNRAYLLVALAVCLAPWGYAMYDYATATDDAPFQAARAFFVGGLIGLVAAVMVTSLLASAAFAAERTDRSAEFLAYLPMRRDVRLISKLSWVLATGMAMWLTNPIVVQFGRVRAGIDPNEINVSETLIMTGVITIAVLGVSWIASTRLASAAALLLGLVSPAVLSWIAYGFTDNSTEFELAIKVLCVVVGIIAFVAGSVLGLLRDDAWS